MANTNNAAKTGATNNKAKPASNNTKATANNKKNDSVSAGGAGYYTRNIPTLVLIGIFFFLLCSNF